MSFYEVKVVDRAGGVFTTLNANECNVESVTVALNEPGMASIRVPLYDAKASSIVRLEREIQVWRDGVIAFWGIPVQRQLDGQSAVWSCPGSLWPYTHWYFGPQFLQFLANPRFETNLLNWAAVGCTATHSPARRIRGPGSARLVSTVYGDNYLEQQYVVSSVGASGWLHTVVGWYWIDPAVPFTDTAFGERGLYISSPGAYPDEDGATEWWAPITMNAPEDQALDEGKPQRLETTINLAPSAVPVTVTVRLYSPAGAIHWGAMSLTVPEGVSADHVNGSDATEVMRRIIESAQNGKTNTGVQFNTADCPPSGRIVYDSFGHTEMANLFATLQTYPERGFADFDVAITPTTKRFKTYAPKRGSYKSTHPITMPGTAIRLEHQLDGDQTATRAFRRFPGSGPGREYGQATDTSKFGGLILESVADIPPGMTLDALDVYAQTELALTAQEITTITAEMPATGWWGEVFPGDTVPVTVNLGAVQETGVRRIRSITLNPRPDTVTIEMIPA